MKSWNGYEVVDEKARKDIEKLDINTNIHLDNIEEKYDESLLTKLTAPQTAKVGQIFKVKEVNEDGTLTLEAVDMPSGDVKDVQIDGTSIVGENGVAEIPKLSTSHISNLLYGLPALSDGNKPVGIGISTSGSLMTLPAMRKDIKNRVERDYFDIAITGVDFHNPICPGYIDYAVKSAMTDGKGEAWTAEEQAAARARMGAEHGTYKTGKIVLDEETKIVNVDLSSLLSEKDEITDVYVLIESDQVVSAGSGNITSDTTNGIIGFFGSMSFSESQKRFVRMHTFVESDICVCECSSGNGNETSGNNLAWQYYKNSMENSGSLKKARKFTLNINATMSQGDTVEFYFAYRKGTYA